MLISESIMVLYSSVLHEDIVNKRLRTQDIRTGVQKMAKDYAPESANFTCSNREFPDYDNAAFRCAYLHKYAPLHTYIVLESMLKFLEQKEEVFRQLLNSGQLKLCCLGGGPGSEVLGVLTALSVYFDSFKVSVTVIDCMKEWESTFSSLVQELKFGEYGALSQGFKNDNYFQWNYLGANLLDKMTSEVNKAIGTASLVTMVKFVSAASCTTAENMIEKICRVMKPGALLLFIDNAAGGFTQLVEKASKSNNFDCIMSRRHVPYDEEDFKIDRFGSTSCYKTKVTILLLRKRFHPRAHSNSPSKALPPSCSGPSSTLDNSSGYQPGLYSNPSVNWNSNQPPASNRLPARGNNLNAPTPSKNNTHSSKLPSTNSNWNRRQRQTRDSIPASQQNWRNRYIPSLSRTAGSQYAEFRNVRSRVDESEDDAEDDAEDNGCSCCVIS